MALFLFTRAILAGKPIEVFNNGHHQRDFTYVDDIVEGVVRASDHGGHAESRLEQRRPRPGDQPRAVSHLQHRQQPARSNCCATSRCSRSASAARRSAS